MEIKIDSKYCKTYKTEAGLQREVSRLEAIAKNSHTRLRWVRGSADNGNLAIVIINTPGSFSCAIGLNEGHVVVG